MTQTHTPHWLLAALVPPEGHVTVEPDGISTATLGDDWLLAAWGDADGNVTVAAYTLPGGRCLHLWCGPAGPAGAHPAGAGRRRGPQVGAGVGSMQGAARALLRLAGRLKGTRAEG